MKLIYFERKATGFHIHAGFYAKGFYIPDENVVLFREQRGTFGGENYSINDDKKFLKEVKDALANPEKYQEETIEEGGKKIPVIKTTYSNIKDIEYYDSDVRKLIQDAKSANEAKRKVRTGIEALLKQVE